MKGNISAKPMTGLRSTLLERYEEETLLKVLDPSAHRHHSTWA